MPSRRPIARSSKARFPWIAFAPSRLQHGNITVLANKFPLLDDDGKPYMIGGVLIDITDQQRLQEQLRLAQKMEAIGRLAGGVAHDFNNLLTIISGYAHMLEGGLSSGKITSSFPEFASEIIKASERAAALTGQLLVFSRKQVIQPVVLNLSETGARAQQNAAPDTG